MDRHDNGPVGHGDAHLDWCAGMDDGVGDQLAGEQEHHVEQLGGKSRRVLTHEHPSLTDHSGDRIEVQVFH
ncbi:MAG: hypothetical protein NVSMB55_21540 [Mycobacteriales bacterium]